jgi:flagellar biosynthesis protein FlhF
MQLKTYRGNSMADALAEVKRDLGQNAVILHARTIRVGGVAGFGTKNMYEITASNQETPVKQPRIASRSAGRVAAEGAGESSVAVAMRPVLAPVPAAVAAATRNAAVTEVDSFQPIEYGTRRPVEIVAPEGKAQTLAEHGTAQASATATPSIESKPLTRSHPSPARGLATRVEVRPTTQAAVRSIDEELASIKQLVGQLLQEQRLAAARAGVTTPSVGASDPLASAMLKLSERLIAPTLAETLLGEVRDTLEAHELRDEHTVQNTLLSRKAARIRVLAGPGPASTKPGPRTIAVVGSTGVGKTTTIAKIAATCKLRQNQRVGLITCDTYRIAAVDQLRTYANIIGLPLKVALTPMEVASARAQLADCDIVFVDTPGRAPTDERRLEELRRFIDSSEAGEIHLALSAGSAEGVMRRAATAFSRLRPDRILLTKLDEAETLGPAFNVLCDLGLPLGCVTNGQEVPDDIEHANPERFARWVLDLPVFSRA